MFLFRNLVFIYLGVIFYVLLISLIIIDSQQTIQADSLYRWHLRLQSVDTCTQNYQLSILINIIINYNILIINSL